MGRYTLKDFSEEILNETKFPMTSIEIWEYGKEKGLDKKGGFIGKAPWTTILQKVSIDVQENPNSKFIIIDSTRPKKISLKSLETSINNVAGELYKSKQKYKFDEIQLHPVLAYFAYTYLERIHTKTINHNKSNKKQGFTKWLHPDMVGVSFPIGIWKDEVVDLSKEMGLLPLKLYSFEIKKELNFSNLRESFFQAVSNSSWAHEGYLAAAEINQDKEFLEDIQRLSNSFGIGIISLDIENPDNSEVLFAATTKTLIDWATVSKLADVNPEFKGFLRRIKNDSSNKEIMKHLYDPVEEVDDILKSIHKFI